MKTIAYLRISTEEQDLDNQRLSILDYTNKHGIKVDDFISIQISSMQSMKDRRINEVLQMLEDGDTLIVSELSRLGRSLGQVIQIVNELIKLKVRFIAIKENITFCGKQDMQTKVMIAMFGLFSEIEKDLISERTKQGLAAIKAKGKILGRPKGTLGISKLNGKENEIKVLLMKQVSKSAIAKIMDISRTALYSFIQSRKL